MTEEVLRQVIILIWGVGLPVGLFGAAFYAAITTPLPERRKGNA
ncbi:MAG: hypothetical protein ACLFV8_04585 [Alphaproteobacteria bacterium]